ncbi:MAG: hypothetical protein AAGK37_02850 [Pseudomonadota bacterium]
MAQFFRGNDTGLLAARMLAARLGMHATIALGFSLIGLLALLLVGFRLFSNLSFMPSRACSSCSRLVAPNATSAKMLLSPSKARMAAAEHSFMSVALASVATGLVGLVDDGSLDRVLQLQAEFAACSVTAFAAMAHATRARMPSPAQRVSEPQPNE